MDSGQDFMELLILADQLERAERYLRGIKPYAGDMEPSRLRACLCGVRRDVQRITVSLDAIIQAVTCTSGEVVNA